MAKASRIAASQAQSLADVRLLVIALCEKAGLDVDKVLGTTEPQTRDEMKAYAFQTKLPAPEPTPAELAKADEAAKFEALAVKSTPAKSKKSKSK